jgi:hypothetical protein
MLTLSLAEELRKTRSILRLAYIEQRFGRVDLDTVPDDPTEQRRREIFLLDLWEVGLLPKRLYEETEQIRQKYYDSMCGIRF